MEHNFCQQMAHFSPPLTPSKGNIRTIPGKLSPAPKSNLLVDHYFAASVPMEPSKKGFAVLNIIDARFYANSR